MENQWAYLPSLHEVFDHPGLRILMETHGTQFFQQNGNCVQLPSPAVAFSTLPECSPCPSLPVEVSSLAVGLPKVFPWSTCFLSPTYTYRRLWVYSTDTQPPQKEDVCRSSDHDPLQQIFVCGAV